jgi:hypothetical protein
MGKKRQAADGHAEIKKPKKQRKEENPNGVVGTKEDSVCTVRSQVGRDFTD